MSMSGLRAAVGVHLAARRARGYRLEGHEQLLRSFLDSLEARGETRITVPAAVAFATAPAGTARALRRPRFPDRDPIGSHPERDGEMSGEPKG